MSAHYFEEALLNALRDQNVAADHFEGPKNIARVATFEQRGVLTRNNGLVVTLADGSEYQVTIVQSKRGEIEDEDEE